MEIFWGIHSWPSVKGWVSPMISSTGSHSWQFFTACTAYATCGLLGMCMGCDYYILFLMFCGPGQRGGHSDYLWASLGCGIYHPPLSSTEVKEGIEHYLFSPCRPWMPVVGWNFFNLFEGRVAWSAVTVPPTGWSLVQILVRDKRFFCSPKHPDQVWGLPVVYVRAPGFFPEIKTARTWS